jgi:Rieske Fe-S protein
VNREARHHPGTERPAQARGVNRERRTALALTCAIGGAGTAALSLPFAASMAPSERAKALGAPVEADISRVKPGEMVTVEWRGQPVWIVPSNLTVPPHKYLSDTLIRIGEETA